MHENPPDGCDRIYWRNGGCAIACRRPPDHVRVDDLAELSPLALEKASAGSFFYGENGEASLKAVAQGCGTAIAEREGVPGATRQRGIKKYALRFAAWISLPRSPSPPPSGVPSWPCSISCCAIEGQPSRRVS